MGIGLLVVVAVVVLWVITAYNKLISLKNQVANLSIEIAEKIMRTRLADQEKQDALVSDLLEDLKS